MRTYAENGWGSPSRSVSLDRARSKRIGLPPNFALEQPCFVRLPRCAAVGLGRKSGETAALRGRDQERGGSICEASKASPRPSIARRARDRSAARSSCVPPRDSSDPRSDGPVYPARVIERPEEQVTSVNDRTRETKRRVASHVYGQSPSAPSYSNLPTVERMSECYRLVG